MALYINHQHLYNLGELKECFSKSIINKKEIHDDIIEYGRSGDIEKWLLEIGEIEMSKKIASVNKQLGDSEFLNGISEALVGTSRKEFSKTPFSECVNVKEIKTVEQNNAVKILLVLSVSQNVNETYVFSLQSALGSKIQEFNPSLVPNNYDITVDFIFEGHTVSELGEYTLLVDDVKLNEEKAASILDKTIEIAVKDCSISMVLVEPEEFVMGVTEEQGTIPNLQNNKSNVRLTKPYYISTTPVTRGVWETIQNGRTSQSTKNQPVTNLSWLDIQQFLLKLNEVTGKQFLLPTEAEWEYAARGGKLSKNYRYSGSNFLEDVAIYYATCQNNWEVATREPNELGIYDMSGLISEWCYDFYSDSLKQNNIDPLGPRTGISRVIKGCDFERHDFSCRIAFRMGADVNLRNTMLGFRLVLIPE